MNSVSTPRKAKWIVWAVTPPIVVLGAKKVLARLRLLKVLVAAEGGHHTPGPGEEPHAVEVASPATEPPEWEYVSEGWERQVPGWDGGAVAQAYRAKWSQWVEALRGPGPLGAYHEVRIGEPIPREDTAAHNVLMSFAYVLARAAHARDRLTVLDWGGGFGHYAVLARAVMPEVQLEWHCREVPSVAQDGASVNPEVTFHVDDACLDRPYDLVLASASLQYTADWQALVRRFASSTIGFLFVTRVPVALRSPSFVVLQRAGAYGYATEYLGWVISRDELIATASTARLKLDREFVLGAWLPSVGPTDETIGHRGFLFRPVRTSARSS